jgi:hypothetical protein
VKRRIFMGLIGSFIFIPKVWSQSPSATNIALLRELVDALGAAGDAISKLTDGFKHLIVTGVSGYDYIAAERERARLIDISRRTANLIVTQNIRVVQSLDDYLDLESPTNEDWQRVAYNLNLTLTSVRELLQDVQTENGEFVLEPAYLLLNQTLAARSSLLEQLINYPAPTSTDEREMLRQASVKYKVLIENAKQAIKELNTYVKSQQ